MSEHILKRMFAQYVVRLTNDKGVTLYNETFPVQVMADGEFNNLARLYQDQPHMIKMTKVTPLGPGKSRMDLIKASGWLEIDDARPMSVPVRH